MYINSLAFCCEHAVMATSTDFCECIYSVVALDLLISLTESILMLTQTHKKIWLKHNDSHFPHSWRVRPIKLIDFYPQN